MSSPRIPTASPRPRRARPKRAALRSFYGLSNEPAEDNPLLDAADFDVDSYIANLPSSVTALLKLENSLIREIRVLDGERKGLVYDNYGRMITATDSIKMMKGQLSEIPGRDGFDTIITSMKARRPVDMEETVESDDGLETWLREGPGRVKALLAAGQKHAAKDEIDDLAKDADAELMTILDELRRQL